MYSAVVFDLFGTLVPYVGTAEFAASLAGTAHVLGCSAGDLSALWCTDEGFIQAVTGQVDCRTRILATCEWFGIPPTEERIVAGVQSRLEAHRRWLKPLSTATEALSALQRKGVHLGLMSVCSDEVPTLWDETELASYFNVALFSCDVGRLKSDREFFSEACRRLSVEPCTAMYIGDCEEELLTADSIGMSTTLMRTRKDIHWDGKAVANPIEVVPLVLGEISEEVQPPGAYR